MHGSLAVRSSARDSWRHSWRHTLTSTNKGFIELADVAHPGRAAAKQELSPAGQAGPEHLAAVHGVAQGHSDMMEQFFHQLGGDGPISTTSETPIICPAGQEPDFMGLMEQVHELQAGMSVCQHPVSGLHSPVLSVPASGMHFSMA